MLVGVLAALGVHFGVLGPVGTSVRVNGARAFGWGEDVVPVGLVLGGVLLVAQRALGGVLGTLASLVLLTLASAGLADLAGGNPPAGASWGRLGGAGGVVGAAVAGTMAKGIGVAGSGVVLAAVAFAAICWLCGARVVVVVRHDGRLSRLGDRQRNPLPRRLQAPGAQLRTSREPLLAGGEPARCLRSGERPRQPAATPRRAVAPVRALRGHRRRTSTGRPRPSLAGG